MLLTLLLSVSSCTWFQFNKHFSLSLLNLFASGLRCGTWESSLSHTGVLLQDMDFLAVVWS